METLRTKHLLLRPWEITDAEALYTQAHNPIIGKRCGWPPHKSVDESREIIEVVLSKPHSFAICLCNNTPIGSIGLLLQGERHTSLVYTLKNNKITLYEKTYINNNSLIRSNIL